MATATPAPPPRPASRARRTNVMLVGAGILGLHPIYYALGQELPAKHMAFLSGSLAASGWKRFPPRQPSRSGGSAAPWTGDWRVKNDTRPLVTVCSYP